MLITKNVTLQIGGSNRFVRIPVSQFDTMWRFVFEIIHNNVTWEIPTGATAVLNGHKPDGNVFAFSGTIANNKVTVDCDVQMTAVAGKTDCELSILADGKTVGTANFILDVEKAPKSADDVVSDTVLDGYGMMVTNAVDSWLNSHSGQIGGLSNEAKQALLTLLEKVAYVDDQGQTYLDALETALYPPANLVSISAVFNQGSAVIYNTDSLDTLKQYLTVTALYSDSTTEVVTTYTLSGTLTAGTSTITVSYGGKTTTFTVNVTDPTSLPSEYQKVEWVGVENATATPTAYIDVGTDVIKADDTLHAELKPFSIVGPYDSPLGGTGSGISGWELYYTDNGSTLKTDGIAIKSLNFSIGTWDSVAIEFAKDTMLRILAYRNNQYAFNGKIKYVSVQNTNGEITHNYIPCYRKSDGAIGVYDVVGGTFFTNSGTGNLVKGSDV